MANKTPGTQNTQSVRQSQRTQEASKTQKASKKGKDEHVLKKLGKTLARKRRVAGFTQEEVAANLGIGSEAFSRIERGLVSPGIIKLYELAEMYKCGIETFLVEGSRRPTDQAEYIAHLIQELNVQDRQFIITLIEKLALRFREDAPRQTKAPNAVKSAKSLKDGSFLL